MDDKVLTSFRLHTNPLSPEDINLNRLDSLIHQFIMLEDDEDPYADFMRAATLKIIEAKFLYLAWIDEEY
jgi:hypothetical protein